MKDIVEDMSREQAAWYLNNLIIQKLREEGFDPTFDQKGSIFVRDFKYKPLISFIFE